MSEWQPIETAPMNGMRILAWNAEFGQRETYMTTYRKGSPGYALWERGEGPAESGWDWPEPKSECAFTWKPTHWKPLGPGPDDT